MGKRKKNATSDLNNEITKVLHPISNKLKEELNKLFESIKRSPIYNLSMADKELFHSNMLAWIFEEYPQVVKKLFKLEDEILIEQVDRERKHFDLLITYNGGKNIIIENKVKSIPYKSQLEKYTESALKDANLNKTETSFYLLSLIKPNWIENENELEAKDHNWKYISFEGVVESISEIKTFKLPYHKMLIDDYKNYCTFLNESIQRLKNNNDVYFIPKIGNNRFDSMLIKWHYSIMKERILNMTYFQERLLIDTIVNSGEIGKIKVGSAIAPKSKQGILEFHYLVDFEKKNKDELKSLLFFGIQIEGNEFRHFIDLSRNKEYYLKNENIKFCVDKKETSIWLDFLDLKEIENLLTTVFTKDKIQGLKVKSNDRTIDQPKSYSGVFYYKNYVMNSDVNQDDVFQLVQMLFTALDNLLDGKKWDELVNLKMIEKTESL